MQFINIWLKVAEAISDSLERMNLVVVVLTLGTKRYIMAVSLNHSKGSGSAVGAGLITGTPAWLQRKINLRPQHRGVHLVTEELLRQVH